MIKNFIYLNEPKLYSFSSQLFEGITEYVLNENHHEHTDQETQKGTIASGRVIADVIKEASTSTTKKFLHDHSFNLFESELINTDNLLEINCDKLTFDEICKSNKSFIRIKAKGKFVDMADVLSLLTNFKDISKALAVLPLTAELQKLELLQADKKNSIGAKSLQAEIEKSINQRTVELAASVPARSANGTKTIIENFGDDIVRFKQERGEVLFSTCLTLEHLREPLTNIYRKYSRKTAKEFIVLGFISHGDGTQKSDIQEVPESAPMLRHILGMAEHMYEFEQIFGRKEDNEIIIEPIAIYTEL
ncbi:DUF6414 family protein [Vibrio fluvialis]|uniref:DUF6414 family protein n=1 Tax=Vibrio fluvialis TaxID=676 RepID=UPI001EEB1E33|nr:hypothetical protein [Vibrio fluvialis]MCG6365326.1 hypothetical protein [Vibrio fluvialis]